MVCFPNHNQTYDDRFLADVSSMFVGLTKFLNSYDSGDIFLVGMYEKVLNGHLLESSLTNTIAFG